MTKKTTIATVLTFIAIFNIGCENKNKIETKENPKKMTNINKTPITNISERRLFIKKTLTENKKYLYKDNVKIFKKILNGTWFFPPYTTYIFNADGNLTKKNDDTGITEKVKWELTGKGILIKNKNKQEEKILDYFILEKTELGYNFYVVCKNDNEFGLMDEFK